MALCEQGRSARSIELEAQAFDSAKRGLGKTDFLGMPLLHNHLSTNQSSGIGRYSAYHPTIEHDTRLVRRSDSLFLKLDKLTVGTKVVYTKLEYPTVVSVPMQAQSQQGHQYQAFSRSAGEIPVVNSSNSPISKSGLFLTPPSTPSDTFICPSIIDDDDGPIPEHFQQATAVSITKTKAKPTPTPIPIVYQSWHPPPVSMVCPSLAAAKRNEETLSPEKYDSHSQSTIPYQKIPHVSTISMPPCISRSYPEPRPTPQGRDLQNDIGNADGNKKVSRYYKHALPDHGGQFEERRYTPYGTMKFKPNGAALYPQASQERRRRQRKNEVCPTSRFREELEHLE